MSRTWAWVRLLAGASVLGLLLLRFGTGPFTDAWQVTSWPAVLTALLLTLLGTLTSAWRWRVVSRSLGVPLTVRDSLTAYYRSQFLNSALPGGVLGDAHRAVRHGRASGDLTTGVRATVWERLAGQAVQVGLAVAALVLLPTPWQGSVTATVAVPVLLGILAALALVVRRRSDVWLGRDLRTLLRPAVALPVVLASGGSTVVHLAVLAVAVRSAGVTASPTVLLATGLVVLVGSAVPLNVAGWGPREGVAAWAFGVVGLGSAAGLTVSLVYGVLAAAATLPGALVLVGDLVARRRARGAVRVEPVRAPLEAACG
jgi:uncharacterized membrane protein YbhN (UPF0104 family)